MYLEKDTVMSGFRITASEELPEIDGTAHVGIHEASGARLLYLRNEDDNKSFAIGFRTPPADDTGVFHILEHSVLCGSRKFPVKEPFVDLLKGSMQTFLNAMTFADKTLYPVASTNEQDLFNLMDVYLDAVFHPRIFEKRAIFEQEGWHLELAAADGGDADGNGAAQPDSLVYNGVVFNEMKGALSDANSVLYDELQKALFPDTCYAFESGGTPEAIPTLTYEQFLDEHRRHYRTDNSYIILYGNVDIERALAFLDERYLTPISREQNGDDRHRLDAGLEALRPRSIEVQAPCRADFVRREMDTAPENACAGCAYVIGTASDRMRATAVEILLDALLGSNEAPLKRALLDAGVAHDVQAFVSDALLQPFAVVQLQMPAEGIAGSFEDLLAGKVHELLDAGLDKVLVEAALSHAEFQMREHDLGYADGVVNSMVALASWLYDDEAPLDYLRYERVFADLRAKLATDYFENLCRELFCDNGHVASVEIVPSPGQVRDANAERLADIASGLTEKDRRAIMCAVDELRREQETPDTPEAIASLPRLAIDDIGDAPFEPAYRLDETAPIPCLRHDVATRGIAYAYRYYDLRKLTFEDLPYASVLASVLGKLDTDEHTAAQIDTLVQGKLGNLSFFIDVYENPDDALEIEPRFIVGASALSENIESLANLPVEIMTKSDFGNTAKVLDVLKQRKILMEQSFANAGHQCASARCKSYYTAAGVVKEQISNVDFYRFLCDLIEQFDECATDLSERLSSLAKRLFNDSCCTVSFGGSEEDFAHYWTAKPFCKADNPGPDQLAVPAPAIRNEAFAVPSDVCYAAQGFDHRLVDGDYAGAWLVAARALSLDYLWNEVRVKGGAYGTGFQALRSGNLRFYSYRDPHLDETLERFAQAEQWLSQFEPSEDDMVGYIVSSVASMDAPVKPRELIRRQDAEHFSRRTPEERQALRKQILSTDVASIQAFAPIIAQVVSERAMCAFGNRAILEASQVGLDVIPLVG